MQNFLRGLLPPRVHSEEEQMGRVLSNLRGKATNLEELTKQLTYAMSQKGPYLIDVIM